MCVSISQSECVCVCYPTTYSSCDYEWFVCYPPCVAAVRFDQSYYIVNTSVEVDAQEEGLPAVTQSIKLQPEMPK